MKFETMYHLNDYEWDIPSQGELKKELHFVGSKELLKTLPDDLKETYTHISQMPGINDTIFLSGNGYDKDHLGVYTNFCGKEEMISPSLVGKNINFGTRIISTNLIYQDIEKKIKEITKAISQLSLNARTPKLKLLTSKSDTKRLLEKGLPYLVKSKQIGNEEDLSCIEKEGHIPYASISPLDEEWLKKNNLPLGLLDKDEGSIQMQLVDEIYDTERARIFGLFKNQIIFIIRSGSLNFGKQIYEHFEKIALENNYFYNEDGFFGFPINDEHTKDYLKAYGCATNYAYINREILHYQISHVLNEIIKEVDLHVIYDSSENSLQENTSSKNNKKQFYFEHRNACTYSSVVKNNSLDYIYQITGEPLYIHSNALTTNYILANTAKDNQAAQGIPTSTFKNNNELTDKEKQDLLARIKEEDFTTIPKASDILKDLSPSNYTDIKEYIEMGKQLRLFTRVAKVHSVSYIKG